MSVEVFSIIHHVLNLTNHNGSRMDHSDLLLYLKMHRSDNPKKMKKAATRIAHKCTPEQLNGTINPILKSKDPTAKFDEIFNQVFELQEIVKHYASEGYHGFLKSRDEIHPVKLDTRSNWLRKDDRWSYEDECLIATRLGDDWMRQHNRGSFEGAVVLFSEYGFTGRPHDVALRCVKDTSHLERVPGTNLFVDKNR